MFLYHNKRVMPKTPCANESNYFKTYIHKCK